MKSTGIVRRIDELGRIVIPMELRKSMDLNIKDPIEILTDGDNIILRKYSNSCALCGEGEDIIPFGNKHICPACLKKIKEMEI
ncbi:MAG: AbrB/MazE/SpoVT family DNA-binding domain-containing protein [Oscillospiraceae bacterium]|nr:AbrB/MazE/SpoVT family DNA-binding domain-containing protein [Ruminococcus sp.]MCD7732489.1 AbrB/MazE/SpoVT family DNA-binding domain-containing protein [Oscillospiraceae bacterium]MCD7803885.1 AbrB/MazE/SpoVT family DNA-binding domain-containing protein [Oscillospiraceae bacterium]MCD7888852.1 AbrB/MazE/SpoVT family DNA-binding domain-containing protein [Oscillospiraceae bacterium]